MKCECPLGGMCSRRGGVVMPAAHHKRCQAGQGDALDRFYAREPENKVVDVSTKARSIRAQARSALGHVNVKRSCCSGKGLVARILDRASQLAASAVDFARDGMALANEEQQASRLRMCSTCSVHTDGWCDAEKGGCGCNLKLKVMARAAYCPQGKWFAHTETYKPLVSPTRSLIFHIYPKRGAEWNWHWHLEQIRKHQDKFNGSIVIGVSVDNHTATIEDVQRAADGINVTQWIRADNTKALAETLTHVTMMKAVLTDDPNAIVFRFHTKGVTKTRDAVEQRWAELLWEVNMDLPSVEDALASHLTCGAMRSMEPLVKAKPGAFFFAGSAYWFRAKEAFERDWTHTDRSRWWVEYVPSHLFAKEESACLLYDLTESSVIRNDHFTKLIQPEWDQWKGARAT